MQIFITTVVLRAPVNSPVHYEALAKEMAGKGFTDHLIDPASKKVALAQGQFVIGVLETKHTTENIAAVATQAAQAATNTQDKTTGLPFHIVCALVDGMPLAFSA